MVKVGIASVNGRTSSKNTKIVPLTPPKSTLNRYAEIGAQTISIHSQKDGTTYDSIPTTSNNMHSHNGGSMLEPDFIGG